MYYYARRNPDESAPAVGIKVKVVMEKNLGWPPSKVGIAEILEVSGNICRIRVLEIIENQGINDHDPDSAKSILPDFNDSDTLVIPITYLWARES